MPYDIDFYKEGFADFCFSRVVVGGEQIECVAEDYETERVWVRTGHYPAPGWTQHYTDGDYGSAWDDLGYGTKLERLLSTALEALEKIEKYYYETQTILPEENDGETFQDCCGKIISPHYEPHVEDCPWEVARQTIATIKAKG